MQLGNLAAFILGSLKDENSGRVALYHYIKNFCRTEETLTVKHINDFFAEALQMNFWMERKAELYSDIKELLGRFFSVQKAAFSLDPLWDLPRMQFIALTQGESLFQTVKVYEQSLLKDAETMKIIPDSESRMIVIKRSVQGTLVVRTYNNLVRIQGAHLIPLTHDQQLFYNEVLELQTGVVQSLRFSPHTQMRFDLTANGGAIAQTISGSAFRQSQLSQLKNLNEMPSLFAHLKRLEKYYVFRASDPYYVELTSSLDKALELVKSHEPRSIAYARNVFESAQIAFDQIFPDDKALYMKLKELAKYLTVQNKEVPSFDHSPTA